MATLRVESLRKATLVVLVTSTTGEGEFPKNARRLWTSLLKKKLPTDYLGGLQYTTFGLGDSSYAKYASFWGGCFPSVFPLFSLCFFFFFFGFLVFFVVEFQLQSLARDGDGDGRLWSRD